PGKALFAACSTTFFLLLVLSTLYFLYHAPILGIRTVWDENARIWEVAGSDPGCRLKQGDRLLQLEDLRLGFLHLLTDNIYIADRSEIFAWFEAKQVVYDRLSRPQVRVVIVRDGHVVETRIPVHKAGLSFLKRLESLHLLVGTAFFLIGLIVFWKKGFEEVSLVFCLLCMALTLTFVTNAASLMSEIVYEPACFVLMNMLNIPNPMAIGALMLHFSLLMPVKRDFLVRFPWVIWPFYASCAAIGLTLAVGIMNLVFPILFIGALAAMGQGYVQYKNPILRQQMRWVIAGFCFGLLPFVLINGIPLLVTGERLVNDTVPGLFLIFIPLFMAFAVQRTRLMDIDTLFDNTLIYSATFGALTVMDMAVVALFARFGPEAYKTYEPLVTILSIWLAIILYVPLRNLFKKWIRRMLKRELYDLNEVSVTLSGRLMAAVDIPSVFEKTLGMIDETLHPKGGYACLMEKGTAVTVVSRTDDGLPPEWSYEAARLPSSAHLYEIFYPKDIPPDYSAGVLVPMIGPGGATGCLVLKNKHSGRMYGRNDLNLLDMAAGQASLAIESISSREAMQAKEKEAMAVKEHLSREMHDGIGSSFSNAIMMLDLLSKEVDNADEGGRRIVALKNLLTEGLSEIRSLIRTMEEEGSTLEDLSELLRDKVDRLLGCEGIAYGLHRDIARHDLPLSPLVIHHLLRIVQEGVTNALKHSCATEMQIMLREKEGLLTLSITDNGKGFDIGLLNAAGYGLRNMKKRCDEICADLRFSSSPGKGANISVVLSIPPAAPFSPSAG
ncbi:hypothetical protein EG829_08475, partial [bacterium]|nr:hypothetical protein [bacterium]